MLMNPILSKLEGLARRVYAHLPAAARGVIQRLEAAYQARRGKHPSAASASATETPPAAAEPRAIPWELRSQSEIVDHIEHHYHAGIRRDLPVMIEAARKIQREHASHADVPKGLSDLLAEFFMSLDSHMLKEEHMLFVALRGGARGGEIEMPMRMMERDHGDHADELEKIRTLTQDFVAPADATAEWKSLYDALATLETDLREHIYLEDQVLFARAMGGSGF